MKRREPFEDDGRTVADMSGIYRESPLRLPRRKTEKMQEDTQPKPAYTRKERIWAMLGAMKAVLVIAGVYILGLLVLLAILLLIWKR